MRVTLRYPSISQWPGDGTLSGDTAVAGNPEAPVRRRVTLFLEIAVTPGNRRAPRLEIIGQQWSDATTGAWSFFGLSREFRYTAIGHDHTGVYDPVIKAGLTPT